MEKVAIFIDGGYLNKILKKYFYKSNINYTKLCDNICNKLNVNRLRTYYYTCMPIRRKGNIEDEKKHENMQRFVRNLKRLPRFEVKLGKLQIIGEQFKQKMIDVLMSLDIVDMCFDKQIEQVILIAGDADFVPAIRKAKSHGAIVHLFYHPSSVHNELLDEIDELHLLSKEFIDRCKKTLDENQ